MHSEHRARRFVVHGHVQGVFFRDGVRRQATTVGATGWIVNRPDGAVEAHVEGSAQAVAHVAAFLHKGPRGAHVERVQEADAPAANVAGFEIRS